MLTHVNTGSMYFKTFSGCVYLVSFSVKRRKRKFVKNPETGGQKDASKR